MGIRAARVVVPLVTPCYRDVPHRDSLRDLVSYTIAQGAEALFLLGATGEFPNVRYPHKLGVVRDSVEEARGRVPILVGVSSREHDETMALVRDLNECHVDGYVFCPPFTRDASMVAAATDVLREAKPRVFLYNNPEICGGCWIPIDFVDRRPRSRSPAFAGIKDSSGNAAYFERLRALDIPDFAVFQGKETALLDGPLPPSSPCVAGTGNVAPELFVQLYGPDAPVARAGIAALKRRIKSRHENYVRALKEELVDRGVIRSPALFR